MFMVNVGTYTNPTNPMDPIVKNPALQMGYIGVKFHPPKNEQRQCKSMNIMNYDQCCGPIGSMCGIFTYTNLLQGSSKCR